MWFDVIRKVEGVVTSTSANTSDLFNVIYSKKKKEDEEDGQKDKKRQVIRRNEVTQTFDGELRKFYSDWETLCKGLSREDIGITGAKGGKHLYDMVLNHVASAVQRPNSPNAGNRDGANYEVMDELKRL